MYLYPLTLFCLTVFAANSIFCRFALMDGTEMGPLQYTGIRGLSAALILLLLCVVGVIKGHGGEGEGGRLASVCRDAWKESSWAGAVSLFAYMVCFSLAYVAMPSAPGTLIINMCVQFSMLGWGAMHGVYPGKKQGLGFAVATVGLVVLLLPGLTRPPLFHSLLMALTGFAWGLFSVYGRGARSAALAIAGNFWRAAVFGAVTMAAGLLLEGPMAKEAVGFALAGGLASSLGYILWYALVPRYSLVGASIVQLAVPVITAILGALFLSEAITARLAVSSALILGGIAFALVQGDRGPSSRQEKKSRGQAG